jgi:pSer/pThr/pTyr-binding forkhead associated (FHA) protein
MPQEKTASDQKKFSIDWLLRGTLTKLGDIFDRFTGRRWKPSSSLATSELIDRLKLLLDREAKNSGDAKGVFVPNNIKLKMQWDKFSIDSEEALKKLEHELLIAAIDHINDNRYHTYAPLKLEVKPDYFTEGVKLLVSFDKVGAGGAEEEAEAALNVSVPDLKNIVISTPPEEVKADLRKEIFVAEFVVQNKPKQIRLELTQGQRLSVGRTKENDLAVEDESVSKIHASLVLNKENQLMVADTGSTNGTFINDERIAYGKAFAVNSGDKVKCGTVEILFQHIPSNVEQEDGAAGEDALERANFGEAEELTVKRETGDAKQDISVEETVLKETNFIAMADAVPIENTNEENHQPTEQKVVLDFGENK